MNEGGKKEMMRRMCDKGHKNKGKGRRSRIERREGGEQGKSHDKGRDEGTRKGGRGERNKRR